MNIPVDEMLTELRAMLENFDREPTWVNLNLLHKELMRIEDTCEGLL